MKRLWIGVAFLLVLLAGGIWMTLGLSGVQDALYRELSAASDAAAAQDWDQAVALADSARATWEQYRRITAAFADHEPLEQMDSLFADLDVCQTLSLQVNFAGICSQLAQLANAIGESFQITWWNVL